MNTDSYWRASAALPHFPKVDHDVKADVIVIGAGIAGITAAYQIKRAGKSVILLERDRCAEGDTSATSAHLTCVTDLRLAEKPTYRDALAKRRCLIPAASFYEPGKEIEGRKSPVQLSMVDRDPLAFAGLWETWRDPSREGFKTFTVITTEPNELIGEFHDRMPAILPREAQAAWLHEGRIELLRPQVAGKLIYEATAPATTSTAPKPVKQPKIKPAKNPSQGSLF